MELRTIGTTDFQPNDVVEGYDSLIWTERYRDAGDFELKTYNVDATRALCPINSLLAVKDGNDCMWVENHLIEIDDQNRRTLTISGRSFETFFENRVAHEGQVRMFTLGGDFEGPGDPTYKWQMVQTGGAASEYAYEIIKYRSGEAADAFTYIPNVVCTVANNATINFKPRRYITVKLGTVYERVMEILAMDDLGIRALLPNREGNTLNLQIYDGVDRSDIIQLSTDAGHFSKTQYLWTYRDYKNSAIAHSDWDWTYNAGSSGTGFNRRTGWVDAQDITHRTSPGSNADEKELQARIATYLGQHRRVLTFGGEVSSDIPYKYNTDYVLGDIIQVTAEYNVRQKMRIVELVRTEDSNGETAIPTLELP